MRIPTGSLNPGNSGLNSGGKVVNIRWTKSVSLALVLVALLITSGVGPSVLAQPGGGAAIPAVSSQVVPSPCAVPVTTVFTAGVKDNFSTANGPEPSSHGPLLGLYIVNNYPNTQGFDGQSVNRSFGHTFLNLPLNITAATMEIGLKTLGSPLAPNDTIGLYLNSSNTFAWSSLISALGPQPTIILNLAALPGSPSSILSNINGNQRLDVYVQDDASVDYITLTVETCPKGRIIVDKVTVPAGDPTAFQFTTSYLPGSFSLTDTAPPNDSGLLSPAKYGVSENTPSGWTLTSATCSDGSPVSAIVLDPGETVTCRFVNRKADVPLPPPITYVYSAKIVCGTVAPLRPGSIPTLQDTAPVVPGLYRSAINIHNFWERETTFQQKVAIALPQDQPRGPVTKLIDTNLGPNQAVEVDCYNIVAILQGTPSAKAEFLKGFLVIESPVELEVTAVYTADDLQLNGIAIDVEQVQPHVVGKGGVPLAAGVFVCPPYCGIFDRWGIK